jgi:hypothetical protein
MATLKNNDPKTRKSLLGRREITTSRYKNPKTGEVQKSKYIKYKDGSTKQKTVEKKPGLFGKKITTTTYRGPSSSPKEDIVTKVRHRKEGFLPRVKTTTYDRMMEEKDIKTNLFYKMGSKRERAKLKKNAGVRGEGERTKVKNCLKKGCSANPLNK